MFLPPFSHIAAAEATPELFRSHSIDAEKVVVTHLGLSRNEKGRGVVKASVGYGARSTDVTVDGDVLTFAGGYSVTTRTLAKTSGRLSFQIISQSPDGRTAHAVVHYDHRTGHAEQTGADRVYALLAESDALDLAAASMPMITAIARDAMARSHHGPRARIGTEDDYGDPILDGWLACAGSTLLLLSSLLLAIAACGTPEPALPMACYGAILGVIGSFMMAADACNFEG